MSRLCLLFMVLTAFVAVAQDVTDPFGAVVRRVDVGKTIYMVFSADSAFEGAPMILEELAKRDIKGSFFFTGNFLRRRENADVLRRIIHNGHYVGGHSDRHILYADWDEERATLVPADSLAADVERNYLQLARLGISRRSAHYYLPPYEWYNAENVGVLNSMGLTTINFTPGLWTSEDYTTPDMVEKYRDSEWIETQLFEFEAMHTLDGAIMLVHLGTHPSRTDKFYRRLPEIIDKLIAQGYKFDRF